MEPDRLAVLVQIAKTLVRDPVILTNVLHSCCAPPQPVYLSVEAARLGAIISENKDWILQLPEE